MICLLSRDSIAVEARAPIAAGHELPLTLVDQPA
jgi:hypothetical protein